MAGSVSGGCVEGAVVETALAVIASGEHVILDFGVSDEMAWEVGLACGGEIQIFVECLATTDSDSAPPAPWLDMLRAKRARKDPVVLTLDLETGEREVRQRGGEAQDRSSSAVHEALQSDTPRIFEHEGQRLFLQPFNPRLRLVVVGAVHIAQPLSRMAADAGYEVIVVDPRSAFSSEARFPNTRLERDWPDEALQALSLDSRTAVVTLTHDPKLDDPALHAALASPAFYVGSLGSQRTHARRLERLREVGFDAAALARIHGPVGLDIGARSPAEIAISILGEMTACLRSRSA